MIVVLINREEDTDTRILRKVYQGLDDIRLMVNPTKEQLEDVLRRPVCSGMRTMT